MHALEELQAEFETQLLFVESGGDNLAGEWGRTVLDQGSVISNARLLL